MNWIVLLITAKKLCFLAQDQIWFSIKPAISFFFCTGDTYLALSGLFHTCLNGISPQSNYYISKIIHIPYFSVFLPVSFISLSVSLHCSPNSDWILWKYFILYLHIIKALEQLHKGKHQTCPVPFCGISHQKEAVHIPVWLDEWSFNTFKQGISMCLQLLSELCVV